MPRPAPAVSHRIDPSLIQAAQIRAGARIHDILTLLTVYQGGLDPKYSHDPVILGLGIHAEEQLRMFVATGRFV